MTTSASPPVSVRLLGPFVARVRDEGATARRKTRAMVAYLAATGRAHTRTTLADLAALPEAFDADAFSAGRVGIAFYNPGQSLVQAAEWDGAWTTSVVAESVAVATW